SLVSNPIFSNLRYDENPSANIRDPGLVVVEGIVGVPWQDIARDPNDLKKGLFTASELAKFGTWDVILGDPSHHVAPTDPLMIESVTPRKGANPVIGAPLVQPGNAPTNPINGSEYDIPNRDDLQYACIFPIAESRDCTDATLTSCDCVVSSKGDDPNSPI